MSSPPPASAPPPPPGSPRASHGNRSPLILPLLLIVAGLVALLMNFGLISTSQLGRAFDLWPAGLILLGAVLIFRAWLPRPAVPLAAVVALVLVLGAFAYSTLLPSTSVGTAQSDYSAALGGVEKGRLQLDLAGGSLTVHGQDMPELYRAHVQHMRSRPPEVRVEAGTVHISDSNGFAMLGVRGANQVLVSINQTISWDVDVGGGASRDSLELSSVHLASLQLSGGAKQVDITLPRPSGTVPVRISGGANNITVHRPSGVAARALMSGGASNLTIDGNHRAVVGGEVTWQSADFDAAADRYEFEVSGGASNVTLDQR